MMNNKVILIGVDGATWSFISLGIKRRKLPAFKELIEKGAHCELTSTIPPISPSAWTSIFTGTNPGKHNIFGFVKRKKDSYFVTPISSYDRKVEPIWRLISDKGKRCILLNIPFSYPPDKINGIMTTGLGTPSKSSEFTYPKTYRKELLKKFPQYDVDFNEDRILLGLDKDPAKHISDITDEQIKLAKHLFKKEAWDFFSLVFRSTDVIQHFYWKNENVVLDCYQQIDKFLNWILKNIAPNTLLLICSDHGFAPVHTNIYINNWLKDQGLLKISSPPQKRMKKVMPSAETLQELLLKLGCRNLVWKLKRSKHLEKVIGRLISSERGQHLFEIEWPKTSAYFLEGSEAMVNINLSDREPEGKIENGEWSQLCDKVIENALELKDPETGKKVINSGYRGDEIYKGKASKPDIVFITNEGYRLIGGFNYSGEIFVPEKNRFGEHERHGIFIAYGKEIREGKKLEGATVYDIAPTILSYLKISIPSNIDGRLISEAFNEDCIK